MSCYQVQPSPLLGISLARVEGEHTLTITKTSVATFGNYSCVAKNSLGTFKKHIEVSSSTLKWKIYWGHYYLWRAATIMLAGRFTGGRRKQLSSAQAASLDTEVFNSPGRFARTSYYLQCPFAQFSANASFCVFCVFIQGFWVF